MSDVKNKTVNIYIDQGAAINALDNLQKKAEVFSKKIEDARTKQKELLETIQKSETAASNIDSLRKEYISLTKEINTSTKKLAENKDEVKNAKQQMQLYTDKLIDAKDKQQQLAEQINKASDSGKSTTRLQQQYAAVTKEIERTIEKITSQDNAFSKATQETAQLANELSVAKTRQKELNSEIKLADNAVKTIKKAESQFQSLSHSINANTDSLNKNAEAQKGIQSQVDKGLRPSFSQTQNLVNKLRNELVKMSEDAPGYAEKFKAFQNARSELDRLSQSMNGVEKAQRSWLQEAKVVAFGVLIGNTVQSAIGAISSYIGGIVSGNSKAADSLADIQRVAGLTGQEAQDLNKKLKAIDTRTATEQLREIAIVAGKLGVAKEDIAGFTKSVDQLVVALGDELGSADQITTTLGKILNVFDGKVTGENILELGNAFVVLANAGVASGGFIAEFTQRVSGIAKASGISLGATVGLGAGLEELGSKVESSGTAVQKLITTIGSNVPKAAKIAGAQTKKEIQDFANLFARAPEEAILRFAEGLTKNKAAFAEISASFKDAGEDGARTVSTLIQLGQKADFFREKMDLGRKSIANTSAITDAFNLKNQTLGAELEKLGKKFSSFIQSKTLTEFFRGGVKAIIGFIDVLKAVPDYIANNKSAIALLVTGIAIMNASYITAAIVTARDSVAKAYNAIVTRLTAAATNLSIAAQAAYITVTTLLTGRITLATAAQRLWSIALSLGAGPIGIIIIAAGALALAIGNLTGATKTLTAEQKLQAEIQSKTAEDVADQKTHTNELLELAKDLNLEYSVRKQALDALIKQNPDYLQGLTLENINTQKGVDIVEDYISALDRLAKAKALRGIKEDLAKQRLSQDIDLKVQEAEAKNEGFVSHAIGNVFGTGANAKYTKTLTDNVEATEKFNAATEEINQEVSKLNFTIGAQEAKLKTLKKGTEEYTKAQRDLNSSIKERNIYLGLSNASSSAASTADVTVTYPKDKTADKKAKKEESDRAKLLKQLQDFQFELSQVGKQADESEIDRIGKKYAELTEKASRYSISYIEIEKAKNKAVAYLIDQEQKKREEELRKTAALANEEQYKAFQEGAVTLGEKQKEAETKKYANGVINKRQLEDAVRKIDIETLAFQIGIAEKFVGVSKQASSDIVAFNKKKNKEDLDNAVKSREFKEALSKRENLAAAQVGVLKTPEGSKARLGAQLNLLKVEHDQELTNTELTNSEKEKLNEEYRQKELQLTVQFYIGQIDQTLNYISQGLDIIGKLNDAKTSKENAALKKELKNNDARKNSIKKLEESKVISAQESRRRISAIEKEEDAKKEALEKKQFERRKKQQIAQAFVNGALGITSILAAIPGPLDLLSLGVSRYIAIGLNIATTAAAIKEIADQKFADGGQVKKLSNGKINTERNIPTQPNGDDLLATVKVGEVLLNEEQQRRLGGAATFRAIGVPGFASGGVIKPFWQSRPYRTLDYGRVSNAIQVNKYAEGGRVSQAATVSQPAEAVTDPRLLDALQQSQLINISLAETINNLKTRLDQPFQTVFSSRALKDLQDREKRRDAQAQFK